jgi:hypothetical protein
MSTPRATGLHLEKQVLATMPHRPLAQLVLPLRRVQFRVEHPVVLPVAALGTTRVGCQHGHMPGMLVPPARPPPGQGQGTGRVARPGLVRALAPGAAPLVRGLRSEGSRVGGTQLAGGVHAAGRASSLRRCSKGQP